MNWYFKTILSETQDSVNSDGIPADVPDVPIDKKYKTLGELDPDRMYELFSDSYQRATGKAWEKSKFLSRADGWRFYGDEDGCVTVREQRSGMLKLTSVAGSPRSIIRGMNDLKSEGVPVWGLVDKNIQTMANRFGFKSPPGPIVQMMMGMIPAGVFGGATLNGVGNDGDISLEYPDVGQATKYLIGNTEYYQALLGSSRLPDFARSALEMLI